MRVPTLLPTSAPMSPTQVAHATGASRRTVMRAIEARQLLAFRDNRNHWKITPQAVEEWALAQCAPSGQVPSYAHAVPTLAHPSAHAEPSLERLLLTQTDGSGDAELRSEGTARRLAEVENEAATLRVQLDALKTELHSEREARRLAEVEAAELRGKLPATEAERDRLHGIIQQLTLPAPPPSPRRRWWPF